MATIEHIFRELVHRFPSEELDESRLVADKGVEGCIHGRPGSKQQVLVMDAETLERLEVPPGAVKENITTRGLDLRAVAEGDQFQIGGAVLEVTAPCHPCDRMDEIRMGLKEELKGQRGVLCRVIQAGTICRGDAIKLMPVQVLKGVQAGEA